MSILKATIRTAVMVLALIAVLSLSQIDGFSQTAIAEGTGGETPADSIIAPEPIYQPDSFGLLDAFGLFLDAMF